MNSQFHEAHMKWYVLLIAAAGWLLMGCQSTLTPTATQIPLDVVLNPTPTYIQTDPVQTGVRGTVIEIIRTGPETYIGFSTRPAVVVVIDQTGSEATRAETDADGAFVINLTPGEYELHADPINLSPLYFAHSMTIVVLDGMILEVDLVIEIPLT